MPSRDKSPDAYDKPSSPVDDRGHTIRNLSWATQLSYIYAVAKFSRHFNPSPEGLDDCMHEMAPFKLRKVRTMGGARNLRWEESGRLSTMFQATLRIPTS